MNKTNPFFDSDRQDSNPLIGLEENRVGRYVLKRLLGRGGMGVVYEALSDDNQRVAIKLLDPTLSSDPEFKSVFLHEIVYLSRSHHPGLVKFVDSFFVTLGTLALVMEYVNGVTLRSRLHSVPDRRLPLEQVLLLGMQVASAIGSLHEQGIVHGDLKPENLMIVPGTDDEELGSVKVIDFGIARTINQTGLSGTRSKEFGTPLYEGPERAAHRLCTAGSDVYALGVLLHEAAAGQPPMLGTSNPFSLSTELPPSFVNLLRQMLASDPGERPSMGEVERRLSEIASDLVPSRMTPLFWEKAAAPRQELPLAASARGERLNSGRRQGLVTVRRGALATALLGLAAVVATQSGKAGRSGAAPAPDGMSYIEAGVAPIGSTSEEANASYAQCLKEACQSRNQCGEPNPSCHRDSFEREQPRHRVLLSHDFYVDNELVTKAEFARFLNNLPPRRRVEPDRDTHVLRYVYVGNDLIYDLHELRNDIQLQDNKYVVKDGRENQPVEQVTWIGAYYYCRYKGKELLTEAQWEYLKTRAGGMAGAERLNMNPGLAEWVADEHRHQYAPCQEPCADPMRGKNAIDPASYRVLRGCARSDLPVFCRASARGLQKSDTAPCDTGFRCMTPIEDRSQHSGGGQRASFGCIGH